MTIVQIVVIIMELVNEYTTSTSQVTVSRRRKPKRRPHTIQDTYAHVLRITKANLAISAESDSTVSDVYHVLVTQLISLYVAMEVCVMMALKVLASVYVLVQAMILTHPYSVKVLSMKRRNTKRSSKTLLILHE